MRKQSIVTIVFSMFLLLGINQEVNAQFGKKLKGAFGKAKIGKGKSGGSSFAYLNNETDDLGMSGEYFGLVDTKAFGFKFVKESEKSK